MSARIKVYIHIHKIETSQPVDMTEFPRIILKTQSDWVILSILLYTTWHNSNVIISIRRLKNQKISISFPPFFMPIKTMQDLMNNPYFLFTLISTKQVFLTPASPTPYLVKLQRPATNCCHDLYTFVTFDTVYLVCLGQLHRQWHWRAIS